MLLQRILLIQWSRIGPLYYLYAGLPPPLDVQVTTQLRSYRRRCTQLSSGRYTQLAGPAHLLPAGGTQLTPRRLRSAGTKQRRRRVQTPLCSLPAAFYSAAVDVVLLAVQILDYTYVTSIIIIQGRGSWGSPAGNSPRGRVIKKHYNNWFFKISLEFVQMYYFLSIYDTCLFLFSSYFFATENVSMQ